MIEARCTHCRKYYKKIVASDKCPACEKEFKDVAHAIMEKYAPAFKRLADK